MSPFQHVKHSPTNASANGSFCEDHDHLHHPNNSRMQASSHKYPIALLHIGL